MRRKRFGKTETALQWPDAPCRSGLMLLTGAFFLFRPPCFFGIFSLVFFSSQKLTATHGAATAADLDHLFDSLDQLWKVLCSYTHSGALQLSRRFTFDEVKPAYGPREIALALNSATTVLLFCLPLLFGSVGAHNEAEETGTMLLQWDFGERLRSGQ
jgi:hypothetical protein